jgi:hypothetical protein
MARLVIRYTAVLAVAIVAVACATNAPTTAPAGAPAEAKHGRAAPEGPVIRFGEGHFSKTAKAFHYWDKEPAIPAVCAKCHAADGVATFLRDGKNPAAPHVKGYGFACTNCHADAQSFALRDAPKVTFASGVTVDTGDRTSNLCMQCHMGRESTDSVNKAIAGLANPDQPEPKLNFVHLHYKQAGATQYGGLARIGYQYAGKQYSGRYTHDGEMNTCGACHDAHTGEVRVAKCGECHKNVKSEADLRQLRHSKRGDFDGNGRVEGVAIELDNQKAVLYEAIQRYSREVGGVQIAFSPAAFPYWYADRNGNGKIDPDELRPDNKYPAYTPRLLQAVYNYTFTVRDPGAAYHNGAYTLQLVYDSLESLGQRIPVKMDGRERPAAK